MKYRLNPRLERSGDHRAGRAVERRPPAAEAGRGVGLRRPRSAAHHRLDLADGARAERIVVDAIVQHGDDVLETDAAEAAEAGEEAESEERAAAGGDQEMGGR